MKRLPLFGAVALAVSIFLPRIVSAREPVDYVCPMIGTDGTGHTFPGAVVPFGMVQLSPDAGVYDWPHCSGYHYSDQSLIGFRHTHLSGTAAGAAVIFSFYLSWEASMTFEDDRTASGFCRCASWGPERSVFFVAEFFKPVTGKGISCDDYPAAGANAAGKPIRTRVDFTTVAGDQSVSRTLEYACGAPWRTQQHVRDVMTKLYDNTLAGLCGHDDCGQMSVWYVSSALGFYPFDPTTGVYVLGSPLVESATPHLQPGFAAGKEFKIVAHHNSPKMGPEPNVTWGAAEGDRPQP